MVDVAALRHSYDFIIKLTCRRQTFIIHYSFEIIHLLSLVFQPSLTGGFKGAAP